MEYSFKRVLIYALFLLLILISFFTFLNLKPAWYYADVHGSCFYTKEIKIFGFVYEKTKTLFFYYNEDELLKIKAIEAQCDYFIETGKKIK